MSNQIAQQANAVTTGVVINQTILCTEIILNSFASHLLMLIKQLRRCQLKNPIDEPMHQLCQKQYWPLNLLYLKDFVY
jgi:hypothetical protein